MRYAIMRNATPRGEVSIRLRIDAGSLAERDDQQGFAHLIEHMSFRGTTHVPQSEEWTGLQRLGMAMGADVSAFTTNTETFYQLDLPNADPNTLDTGLIRMRETASEILMRPDALEAERGTVLSEERTRDTPGLRTSRAELAFFYQGQPIATHLPIGTRDNIEHAPAAALLDFYRAFYRPERATLIVVGDADPDRVEARIRSHFSDWRPVGLPGVEPSLGRPASRGAEARLVVDPNLSRAITVAWVSPYDANPRTIEAIRRRTLESVALAVVNHRLARLASLSGGPFLSALVSAQDLAGSASVASLTIDMDPQHWQGALVAADTARRQALQFGVTQDEVDRVVAAIRATCQAQADGAATRATPALASALLSTADANVVFASPTENLALISRIIDGLTAADVTAALRGMYTGAGPLVFVSSPIPIPGGEASVLAAFNGAEASPLSAPAPEMQAVWPYQSFGLPGRVVERRMVDDLGLTQVRFANGVRLTVKPTRFSQNQVLVQARIGAGVLELPKTKGNAAWAADAGAYLLGGLNAISYDDLQQALSSKVYGLAFNTREDAFVLSGATTTGDLDTQLQLIAAYIDAPGWRPEAFERVRAAAAPQLNTFAASPEGVVRRDIGMLLHDGDPRWATVTPVGLAFARLTDVRATLDTPLAGGPIEVTVVGDVSAPRAIAAVAATLGALPQRAEPAPPPPDAMQVSFPAPTAAVVVRHHKGRADQAMALIAWPAPDFYSGPQRSRALRILEQIFQARLFEQLRIRQGASYVPETGLETSAIFPGYGSLYAAAEVPPDKIDLFFDITAKIAADLRRREVSPDELRRAKDPRVDLFTKSAQTNGYWLTMLGGSQADARKLDVVRSAVPDLERVTAAEVRQAAQAVLIDQRAWRLKVLPPDPGQASSAAPAQSTGLVTINCDRQGSRLADCQVVREDPPGYGLGAEAVVLADKLSSLPKASPEKDGRITFTIRLSLPDPSA
jgi:zinc protease